MDMNQMAQGPADQPEAPPKVAVTITKNPDGTFTVAPETDDDSQETPAQPGMPEADDAAEGEKGQTANSIDQALKMARDILTGNPQMDATRSQIASQVFGGKGY